MHTDKDKTRREYTFREAKTSTRVVCFSYNTDVSVQGRK